MHERNFPVHVMIELEVYAAGVRDLGKILELDHELEAFPGCATRSIAITIWSTWNSKSRSLPSAKFERFFAGWI